MSSSSEDVRRANGLCCHLIASSSVPSPLPGIAVRNAAGVLPGRTQAIRLQIMTSLGQRHF